MAPPPNTAIVIAKFPLASTTSYPLTTESSGNDEQTLQQLRLKATEEKARYWRTLALNAQKERNLAVAQLQKDHEVIGLASGKMREEIGRTNASAGVTTANMVVGIAVNAACGNVFGAVSSVVIGGVNIAMNRKKAYDQQQTLEALNEHLEHSQDVMREVTGSSALPTEFEGEIDSQLTAHEWSLINPDNVKGNRGVISTRLKRGESVAVLAKQYNVDILFMTTFIDLYDLSIPAAFRQDILKSAGMMNPVELFAIYSLSKSIQTKS